MFMSLPIQGIYWLLLKQARLVQCLDCCQYLYFDFTTGVVEVYGSWKKIAPRLESSIFELEVEKQLEEAMAEQDTHYSVWTSSQLAAVQQQRLASTLMMITIDIVIIIIIFIIDTSIASLVALLKLIFTASVIQYVAKL